MVGSIHHLDPMKIRGSFREDALRRDQPGTHERHERGLFDILSPGGKRTNVVTRKSDRRRICA